MSITTKLARHYNNCCEQVMPVPVVMKQLMVDRRPVPCPPPDPPHPPPPPPPPPQPYQYQQFNSPLQPPPQPNHQPYQPYQPIPPNPQPYQPYQPNPQPYSFNQLQPNPQPYQHQLPYQQPYQLTQYGEPTVEKNNYQMVLYQPKEGTVEIKSEAASDIHYRVPPSYPIIEYSNDINALPGQIVIQTTERIPDGYLLCDGSDASREVDSSLFNAIGTFYGSGDDTTTFCLPDVEDEDRSHHYIIKK